jgi:photoactive yellow protein
MSHGAVAFEDPDIFDWLEAAGDDALDKLAFGVVGLAADGQVVAYNAAESALSGLRAERVLGTSFFTSVAPCTNNFMVAHRFTTESALDATIDYVFTFRIAPKRVRLRLLKRPGGRRMYLLVDQRV